MYQLAHSCRIVTLAMALWLTAHSALSHPQEPAPNPEASRMLADARARQPLGFTRYSDPAVPSAAFVARANGYQVALLRDATLVHRVAGSTVDQHMRLLGARAGEGITESPLSGMGDEGPAFGRITYRDVYPGIDATYHSRGGALEYDFTVAPRADSRMIRLSFHDAKHVLIEPGTGALLVTGPDGAMVRHSRPEVYQQIGQERREISGSFRLVSPHVVAFEVGPYDQSQRLIIDPTVSVSRILYGNNSENAYGVAVDASGYSYVTGVTFSAYSFPSGTGASVGHGKKDCRTGNKNPCPNSAFVVKLDTAGNIVAQVLFGGLAFTRPAAIAVDANYVYVAGSTTSATITTAAGKKAPVNNKFGAAVTDGPYPQAFLVKFTPDLVNINLVTLLSSTGGAEAHGIAVDSSGSSYLTGQTCGQGFWHTSGAYQTSAVYGSCDVFVTHLDYFGSFGYGPNYSATFGGYAKDYGNAIAVDATGAAWVAGRTCSTNFPATPGLSHGLDGTPGCNAFLTKLDAGGSTYQYSMYFGGLAPGNSESPQYDEALALTLNGTSGAWVGGYTQANNFYTVAPTGHTPLQATVPCNTNPRLGPWCDRNGFVTYVDAGLNILWSTFLGGSKTSQVNALAKNSRGEVYAAGSILNSAAGFPGAPPTTFILWGGYVTRLTGSLESVGWTNLYGGPVNGIVARGNSISTSVYTAGDTYPNTTETDSFMIKLTDAIASGGIGGVCATCVKR